MSVYYKVGDFFVSTWLWQFTADWFHPLSAGIIMFLIMRLIMRRARIKSFVISFLCQLFSLGMLSAIAIGFFVHLLRWEFFPLSPQEGSSLIRFLYPSVALGLFYAVSQTLLFIVARFFWHFSLIAYTVMCWLSNACGALVSYMIICTVDFWQYTG